MTDIVNIGFSVDTSQIATGQKRMESLGNTAEKTSKRTTAALGGMGRTAGQAGIQIQQLVGQIQMGTSPMVALSQQAADLGFVLGVPLLGAIAGIAASFGSVLLPTLFESTDATKEFSNAQKALGSILDTTSVSVTGITTELAELYRVDASLAKLKLLGALQEANNAMESYKKQITENIGDVLGNVSKIQAAIDNAANTNVLPQNQAAFDTYIANQNKSLDSQAKQLGVTREELLSLSKSYADFEKTGNVESLRDNFSSLAENSERLTPEFRTLVGTFADLAAKGELTKSQLKELNELLSTNKLPTAVNAADSAYSSFVENIKNSVDPTRKYRMEIDDVNTALARGSITALEAETRIKQINLEMDKAAGKDFASLYGGTDNVDTFALEQAKDYDQWIESISTTSTRMAALREEIKKTQFAIAEGDFSDPKIGEEYIADLEKQIKALDVNPFQSMTQGAQDALQAMSGMFENGSKDAKKLAIAMQALNLVQAVGAVLNQGSGDPLTAIGRMAAMAAMVKSLGVSIGGLSGGFADESVSNQQNQNLNTWGEHATSIADATDETASATKKLVGINTDMLKALQNLTMALASASGIIAKNVSIPTVSASITGNLFTDTSIGGFISGANDMFNSLTFNLLGGLTNSIFKSIGGWLGGKSSVTDEGVRIIGGALNDLMDDVTVQAFQSIKYKKWRFGGTRRKTSFKNLGDEVSTQFALVFESIADSVATGAEILGFSSEHISAALDDFVIRTTSLSLKGLSAEKKAEVIENYFSSVFNSVAVAVVPFLRDFQQVGEELGATLSRLATEASVAEYLVNNLGVTFADKFTDQEAFITAADNLATLAGGVEELADQVASFTDAFATDTQKFQIYQEAMKSALEEVGLSLPSSAAGFYELMSSLDATTEAGQQQIATLLGLTDTASAYYKMLDKTAGRFRDAAEGLYEISFAASQVSLDSALAAARLGDFSLAEALDLNSIGPSTSDFSSALEFNLARAETAAKLNELSMLQEGSTTIDEKQLTVLEEIRDSLTSRDTIETSDSTNSQLVAQMAALKSEFKTLSNQITYGVLTVRQETTA